MITNKVKIYSVYLKRLNKHAIARTRIQCNVNNTCYVFVDVLNTLLDNSKVIEEDKIMMSLPLGPSLCLMGKINGRGKNAWKFLFQDDFKDYELYFPEFRHND